MNIVDEALEIWLIIDEQIEPALRKDTQLASIAAD